MIDHELNYLLFLYFLLLDEIKFHLLCKKKNNNTFSQVKLIKIMKTCDYIYLELLIFDNKILIL